MWRRGLVGMWVVAGLLIFWMAGLVIVGTHTHLMKYHPPKLRHTWLLLTTTTATSTPIEVHVTAPHVTCVIGGHVVGMSEQSRQEIGC